MVKSFLTFKIRSKIKADLVLNHLSSEHEQFKRLENGDESALKYFVYTDKRPKYRNKMMHLRLAPYQTLWLDVTPN